MREWCYGFVVAMKVAFSIMWECKWLFVVFPLVIGLSLEAMQDANELLRKVE